MWLLLIVIILAIVAWLALRSPSDRAPELERKQVADSSTPQAEQWKEVVYPVKRGGEWIMLQTTRANQKPTIEPYIEDITLPEGTVDLRALDSRRLRVVGASHHLKDNEPIEAWTFQLVREPNNRHDKNAIAVLLVDGRKIGYVSTKQAEIYTPLLDRLGSKFIVTAVGNAGTTSSRLWVDLPKVNELRDCGM